MHKASALFFSIRFIFFSGLLLFYCVCGSPGYSENFPEPLSQYYGEKLSYDISWFGIPAGKAVLQTDIVPYNGKRALRFIGKVHSALWFSRIYYVEDTVQTYVHPVSLSPYEIAVDFREGEKYHRKMNYLFNLKDKTVKEKDSRRPAIPIPSDVTDMFGAFFSARIYPYRKEHCLKKSVSDGRKCYEVKSAFNGYAEIDSVLGLKRCMEIRPSQVQLDLIGISQNPSSLSIYLTDDTRRIPLLVTGEIRIGSLVAKLIKTEYPN